MRVRSAILGAVFVLWAVAAIGADTTPPSSHLTLSPAPNAYGWNNSPVTATITATDSGSGVKEIHYVLDGGPEEVISGSAATFSISAEGIHDLRYWAVDNAGNVEPPHTATVKIDRTPPILLVNSPRDGTRYILRQPDRADWLAVDNLSGVARTEATAPLGDPIPTDEVGPRVFEIAVWDRAGNETKREINYTVVYAIHAVWDSGAYIDKLLPEKERFTVGKVPVIARYHVGEPIKVAFSLTDYFGNPVAEAVPTLTVVQAVPQGGKEKYVVWSWLAIHFAPDKGYYLLAYDTSERSPGIYDLWIGFGDGQHARMRVELVPAESTG